MSATSTKVNLGTGKLGPPPPLPSKVKKWDNFGNFRSIKLEFAMQVPFTHPHVAVTFGNDPTIFSQTNLTYQKVAYSKIFKLP